MEGWACNTIVTHIQAFNIFAKFPPTSCFEHDKGKLLHGVAALELVGLAVGSITLGSMTSGLWIWTEEVDFTCIRTASSLASGNLLQYLTTTLTCQILTFTHSWSLTLTVSS
ncbi:hypothetical protein BDQ17DRAFT_1337598 [Cyathus striatus]|nr:hypothetical protein BDQ17DRAFT_1337598 [Cyathus striatus]